MSDASTTCALCKERIQPMTLTIEVSGGFLNAEEGEKELFVPDDSVSVKMHMHKGCLVEAFRAHRQAKS